MKLFVSLIGKVLNNFNELNFKKFLFSETR